VGTATIDILKIDFLFMRSPFETQAAILV